MKKVLGIFLALAMVMCAFAGCNNSPEYTSSVWIIEDDESTVVDNQEGEEGNESNSASNTSSNKNTSSSSSVDMSKSLDLKGQKVTMAITNEPQYNTSSFKATISAFEKKYNCKVKTFKLDFENYNQEVSQRMSTGDPYDICFTHSINFPTGPIAGLYADLTEAIKQVGNSNFDKAMSAQFDYNGKKYGVCDSYHSADPIVMFYNAALFEENGLEDPLALYKAGKWTWDKIFEMGKQVTNSKEGIYFFDAYGTVAYASYGVPFYETVNGKVHVRLRNETLRKGFELTKKMYYGNDAIAEPANTNSNGDSNAHFVNGLTFMAIRESYKYGDFAPRVKTSIAFGKSTKNLQIVPMPLAAENTAKRYPSGWYTAVAAGQGSDPRIAVTWADFYSTYRSSVKGSNEMTTEQKELVDSLKSNRAPTRHGEYQTSAYNTTDLTGYSLVTQFCLGKDISQTIDTIYPNFIACLDETIGKGNYVIDN